ncbi:MAG: HEPN domain-containing protein [Candidatus Aenigmarchaeota archaeon]|nr:HEPN domain-containing protein [Candidatus Aenigmarchaeota archaeon]
MDLEVRLYAQRAENELRLAKAVFNLSGNTAIKKELGANEDDTFYSAAISHAYYSIFYASKALLLTKNIRTTSPEIHKKTYWEFKRNFVDTGELDLELLKIYRTMLVSADELLSLFKTEKRKRGHFTYQTISQANIPYAEKSIKNARKFITNILEVIKSRPS